MKCPCMGLERKYGFVDGRVVYAVKLCGGVAGGMQGPQSQTPPGTHLHGCMLGTSSKAMSRHTMFATAHV